MNRRGFLGTLLGAAVAPFLPKPKTLRDMGVRPMACKEQTETLGWMPYSKTIMCFKDNKNISVGDLVSLDKRGRVVPCVPDMEEIGIAVGRAHQEIKVRLAAKMFDLS